MTSIVIILIIVLIIVSGFAIQYALKAKGLEEKLKAQAEISQKNLEIEKEKEIIAQKEAEKKAEKAGDVKAHTAVLFQRNVLKGKISEQVAPFLSGFPTDLEPSEAHFLGNPIDFIVFKGANNKNITEVVFVEVKSGKSHLNSNESSLKETIDNKKVRYVSYHIPEEIFTQDNISLPISLENQKTEDVLPA